MSSEGRAGSDLALFHRQAGARQCACARLHPDRPRLSSEPAELPISERRPADRPGDDALSRRKRHDSRQHRRSADRAERQRRREHDLHAVDERERRHLQLDRHLRDRHGSRRGRDPGPESRVGGDFVAAAGSSAPGRDDEEAIDVDPRVRRSRIPRQPLRQPVPGELRRHQRAGRTASPPRRRRCVGARRRSIRHAHLAEPGPSAGAGTDAAGRHQRYPAAEPGGRGRTDRRAARAERPGLPIYARPQGPARRSERVREHHRQGRFGERRPHHQDTRRRPCRARRADL